MAHHCIGNPCWICFPQHAPKIETLFYSWNKILDKFPNYTMNTFIQEIIVKVFKSGLDHSHIENITLAEIKEERAYIFDDTLTAQLMDAMIENLEKKA
jgi:hypothetical protein